eukprot:1158880-Amphidinium_carterae.1
MERQPKRLQLKHDLFDLVRLLDPLHFCQPRPANVWRVTLLLLQAVAWDKEVMAQKCAPPLRRTHEE